MKSEAKKRNSMLFNQVKTAVLLATLSGLLMFIGHYFGGIQGLVTFTVISLFLNGFAYFFSEKMVLNMYRAKPLDKQQYDWIYDMVHELSEQAQIPMPKLWLVPLPIANAFATGRDPHHASVAVTEGILQTLDKSELRGVLAHELSHVKNRDILISTVAATLATAIGFIAHMMRYMAFWGGVPQRGDRRRVNPLALLVIALFMPLAASLIQLAISRAREYVADESGADISHDPLALAAALEKLEQKSKETRLSRFDPVYATTAHLFIVKPFLIGGLATLFSTHPPMKKRVERLRKMYEKMMHVG